jgi:hypothetical protein
VAKSVQFYNNTTSLFDQYDISDADITLSNGQIANSFYTIKDGGDNTYILCGRTIDNPCKAKIIKMTSSGIKTVNNMNKSDFGSENTGNWVANNVNHQMFISRDQQYLFISTSSSDAANQIIHRIPISDLIGGELPANQFAGFSGGIKFAIYQDRYIWVASGTTVKIYDYGSRAELASVSVNYQILAICVSGNNICYTIDGQSSVYEITKFVFDGNNQINKTSYGATTALTYSKQMLIDKWGDLIVIANSGSNTGLQKYTNSGILKEDLNLSGLFYNLNTDSQGNYYYSNSLATYKIAANTAQGQNFTGTGTKILDSGMTTYGNDTTGYLVSANGSVGC